MLEPRYLKLVRCVVEEGVEGVPLATHPHVVVERSQLLSDHSMSEHLKTKIYGWSMETETCWSHPFSFCHDHNVHDNVLWQSNRSPGGEHDFLPKLHAPMTTKSLFQNHDDNEWKYHLKCLARATRRWRIETMFFVCTDSTLQRACWHHIRNFHFDLTFFFF